MASRHILRWVVFLGLLVPLAFSQATIDPRKKPEPAGPARPKTNLRVDANLVLVPVTVCDPMNKPVIGLEKEHFRVFEDKIEQVVTHFAMDDEPLSVGLVFDISGSMGPKLRRSRMAAAAFFRTANPEDEFFLVEFNDQPRLVVPMTRNTDEIQNQLAFSSPKGRTALLDAIMLAMNEMKKSKMSRKALLVISDGGDNASRYTENEVRNTVRENDVLIYTLGIFEGYASRGRSPEELAGPGLLGILSEQTGGRSFNVDDVAELPDMAAKIGIELRNRYVIGYSPKEQQRDGRYHRVDVKLVPPPGAPKLRAYWRPGYLSPVE